MNTSHDGDPRARVRARLARDEEELRASLGELKTAAVGSLWPDAAIASRPGLLAGAFVLGLWLGTRRRARAVDSIRAVLEGR